MWRLLALVLLLGSCTAPHGTIGALLGQRSDGRLFVRSVPGGLAAARAGLEPEDEILLVDGEDVRGLSPEQLHQRLGGTVGEPVKLTLARGDEIVRVTLKRSAAAPASPRRR